MLHDFKSHSDPRERQESAYIDGLLQDGTDQSALWRAHLRESTMARQAAERRYAQSAFHTGPSDPEPSSPAHDRAAILRGELAHITAEHRLWMREHGIDVLEPTTRKRRSQETPQL